MIDRYAQLETLLAYASKQLDDITNGYPGTKSDLIPTEIPVKIKNYLENLRSLLDYIAVDICKHVLKLKQEHKCYFPISCNDADAFKKHMKKNFPLLDAKDSLIYNQLEKFQIYKSNDFEALSKLTKLVNENKHRKLSPQRKQVSKNNFSRFKIVRFEELKQLGKPNKDECDGYMVVDETHTSDDHIFELARNNIGKVMHINPESIEYTSYIFTETGDDVFALLLNGQKAIEAVIFIFKSILYEKYQQASNSP